MNLIMFYLLQMLRLRASHFAAACASFARKHARHDLEIASIDASSTPHDRPKSQHVKIFFKATHICALTHNTDLARLLWHIFVSESMP